MTGFVQVVTTTATKAQAIRIAQRLLDRRLAGCVQVGGPLTSAYRWQGKIEMHEEWSCVIKTAADRYAEVEREIRAVHPYEEPEILALPVVAGSASYLNWLAGSLRDG